VRPSAQKSRAGPQSPAAAEAGNSLPCTREEGDVVVIVATLEAVAVIEAAAVTEEVMLAEVEADVVAGDTTDLKTTETADTVEAARGRVNQASESQ